VIVSGVKLVIAYTGRSPADIHQAIVRRLEMSDGEMDFVTLSSQSLTAPQISMKVQGVSRKETKLVATGCGTLFESEVQVLIYRRNPDDGVTISVPVQ
jgi:hypothetical protein